MDIDLIFDRTQEDVTPLEALHAKAFKFGYNFLTAQEKAFWNGHPKGGYDWADYKRVETATQYLNTLLMRNGYGTTLSIKTNWTNSDLQNRADIDRIRNNIKNLRDILANFPEWLEILYNASMDFEQANVLEWNMFQIDLWLERMIAAMSRYCGESYCAEETLWTGANFMPAMRRLLIDIDGYAMIDIDGKLLYVRY